LVGPRPSGVELGQRRRGGDEVSIVEMMVVELLVGPEGGRVADQGAPRLVVVEQATGLARAGREPVDEPRPDGGQGGIAYRGVAHLVGDLRDARGAAEPLAGPVGVLPANVHRVAGNGVQVVSEGGEVGAAAVGDGGYLG